MSKIAFIGVGNMAGAIISGITSSKTPVAWEDIVLFDKFTQQYDKFSGKPFVAASSATDAVELADCVVLATKPQNFPEVLGELSGRFNYELICDLGKRIPRVYREGGRVISCKDYTEDIE